MARTNKYTSLNFNDIYEKKIINPNTSSSSTTNSNSRSPSSSTAHPYKSYSLSASSRPGHGGMLVLSRPSPKPQPQPLPQPQPQLQPDSVDLSNNPASKSSDSDSISLRPQGKTGGSLTFQEKESSKADVPTLPSPKSNKFVPPHLRPGFVAREVPPSPEFQKPRQGNYRPGSAHGNYHGSPNRYVEDGRPKSGSGYERRMRVSGPGYGDAPAPVGVESVSVVSNRPRSGGSRPSSNGCTQTPVCVVDAQHSITVLGMSGC